MGRGEQARWNRCGEDGWAFVIGYLYIHVVEISVFLRPESKSVNIRDTPFAFRSP